jgi:hypothetical protein
MVNMDMSVPGEDEKVDEMERIERSRRSFTLLASAGQLDDGWQRACSFTTGQEIKTHLEIPRKVLHASIGSSSLFGIIFVAYLVCLAKVFSRYTDTSWKSMSGQLFSFFGWPWPLSSLPISYASDSKVSLKHTQKSLGFLMRESEWVRDSQLSHSTMTYPQHRIPSTASYGIS